MDSWSPDEGAIEVNIIKECKEGSPGKASQLLPKSSQRPVMRHVEFCFQWVIVDSSLI